MSCEDGLTATAQRARSRNRFKSIVLVEDDEGADDTGDPAAEGEEKDDGHRAASAINYRQRREDNSQ